ncbi:MAG TPA: hypothetical protein VJ942_05045, partial [Roseovarius sp.]|nr:hypothetical protein [Roseovarius sp.]
AVGINPAAFFVVLFMAGLWRQSPQKSPFGPNASRIACHLPTHGQQVDETQKQSEGTHHAL